jgi:hypothetical protein
MSTRTTPHLAWASALTVCLALTACGGGGGGAGGAGAGGGTGGGGGGTTTTVVPSLTASCEETCDKKVALGCWQITAEQCKQQCPYLEQQVGENCKYEYEVLYACQADLEYECVQENPVPVGQEACFDANIVLSECLQKLPCLNYCKQAAAQPCGPADEEACVTKCAAETSYQSDSSCTSDLIQLRTCQGMDGALGCTGATLTTIGCDAQVYEVADCISSEESDWCEGYCLAVETVGCAPAGLEECLLACQQEKHAGSNSSCESYYEDLLRCRTQAGLDCSSGAVSDVGCETQLMSYQTCVMPP